VSDWTTNSMEIKDQPTYQQYRIKIVAYNSLGEANVAAEEVIGFSGEDVPVEAPTNLTLNDVVGPRSAIVSWNPVKPESVKGDFKGYKIQTWTENAGAEKFREIIMKRDSTRSLVQSFKPNAWNYARVLSFNGAFNGPPSNTIKFRTPEGKPGPVDALDCFAMGSSALLLAWKPPQEINGMLTGYRIYYQEVQGGAQLGPVIERTPRIMKDTADKAKLAGLQSHSKYRVTIKATTRAGEGMPYYTECDTNHEATKPPSQPKFKYTVMNPDNGFARIKVTWQPQIEGNPGSHFYVQFKRTGDMQYLSSQEELNEDSIVMSGLDPDVTYDFRVVAVDGTFETPSEILEVFTYSTLPPSGAAGSRPMAHSGWFIGMILAVLFLVLVCVIVCLIKQNRGGKYSVQEREEQQGRRDPYDDGGFPEFTQP
jgi:neuronal cell adhesion protein